MVQTIACKMAAIWVKKFYWSLLWKSTFSQQASARASTQVDRLRSEGGGVEAKQNATKHPLVGRLKSWEGARKFTIRVLWSSRRLGRKRNQARQSTGPVTVTFQYGINKTKQHARPFRDVHLGILTRLHRPKFTPTWNHFVDLRKHEVYREGSFYSPSQWQQFSSQFIERTRI